MYTQTALNQTVLTFLYLSLLKAQGRISITRNITPSISLSLKKQSHISLTLVYPVLVSIRNISSVTPISIRVVTTRHQVFRGVRELALPLAEDTLSVAHRLHRADRLAGNTYIVIADHKLLYVRNSCFVFSLVLGSFGDMN